MQWVAVKAILDTAKSGTGYTKANILENVRQWLSEGNSNYAYSEAKQPLTVEKHDTNGILLPQIATDIQINAAGDTADINLTWSIADETYAELRTSQETGSQYVWVKGTANEPRDISLTVTATTYQDDNGNTVNLNEQVEAYNNLIVGAPIARDNAVNVAVPKLTSGKEETFTVLIPFHYKAMKLLAVDASKITVTSDELENITVVSATTDQQNINLDEYTTMEVVLKATPKQLDAVVASDSSTDYTTAKVTLSIPHDAVTLTDWAIEQGWYIPQNGLELEADVQIYAPLVKVTGAKLYSETEVRVNFNIEYWSYNYEAVRMALVLDSVTNFTGSEKGSSVSSYGEVVTGNAYYDISIPASDLTAGTYNVWVKIGDDGVWMNSNTVYTHATTSN